MALRRRGRGRPVPAPAAPAPATPQPLPSSWTTTSGCSIVPVPEMISAVQDLVTNTWRVKYTRDRKGADPLGRVPTGARVLNVLRVENHEVYQRYARRRSDMKSGPRAEPFSVKTEGFDINLDASINEMYLFHGTNPVAADSIARTDFDMERAGSAVGTMFGAGVYLAENASKSDEYAKEGDGIFVGQCALLLCRALAGRVFTVQEKGDQSMEVKSGRYDCVCGDRLAAVGTFREMIFFSSDSVYCEYIILYSREFGDPDAMRAEEEAAARKAEKEAAERKAEEEEAAAKKKVEEERARRKAEMPGHGIMDGGLLSLELASHPGQGLVPTLHGRCGQNGERRWHLWHLKLGPAEQAGIMRVHGPPSNCTLLFEEEGAGLLVDCGLFLTANTVFLGKGGQSDDNLQPFLQPCALDLGEGTISPIGGSGFVLGFDGGHAIDCGGQNHGQHTPWPAVLVPKGDERAITFKQLLTNSGGKGELSGTVPAGVAVEPVQVFHAGDAGWHQGPFKNGIQDIPSDVSLSFAAEWVRPAGESGQKPGQWCGWNLPIPAGKFIELSAYIKFVDKVPEASFNMGLSPQGQLDHSWLNQCTPDEWCFVKTVRPSKPGGDGNWNLLKFDSVDGPQTVRVADVTMKVYDHNPSKSPGPGRRPTRGETREVYQIKFRQWTDLDPEVQEVFRQARLAGQQTVTYSARGNAYEADLSNWVQRNVKTGAERQLRVKPTEEPAN
eukprot:TRINITY_DN8197_c0_g1_i1.p1 TRINITY_DN8197_c0_g1~~TRINITY_DN8197_c0_g1_i1.p1  ORF type:complete len:725 (+),score=131.97 TRINITY_DN8197_c0_g1_i1:173-2347(+)